MLARGHMILLGGRRSAPLSSLPPAEESLDSPSALIGSGNQGTDAFPKRETSLRAAKICAEMGPLRQSTPPPDDTLSLPNELVEKILTERWRTPMLPEERIIFVASIALVCETWLAMLSQITTKDVYLPSSAYLLRYDSGLAEREGIRPTRNKSFCPRTFCRSITRQIGLLNAHEYSDGFPIQDLLATFHVLPLLPNLRNIAVEFYHNPKTLGSKSAVVSYSASILQMSVEYTFPPDTPFWFVDALYPAHGTRTKRPGENYMPWGLPHLEGISTPIEDNGSESSEETLGEILRLCPHLEIAGGYGSRNSCRIHSKVLFSSSRVPRTWAIVHGPILSTGKPLREGKDGEKVVCGEALGFVLELDGEVYRKSNDSEGGLEELGGTNRTLHFFVQRPGG